MFAAATLVGVMLVSDLNTAQAGFCCGASRYRVAHGACCGGCGTCCQQRCYTVMRTCQEVVYEAHETTAYKTVFEEVIEKKPVEAVKYVEETQLQMRSTTILQPCPAKPCCGCQSAKPCAPAQTCGEAQPCMAAVPCLQKLPVPVLRPVTYQKIEETPRVVIKQVPYPVTCYTAKVVCKQVPVTVCCPVPCCCCKSSCCSQPEAKAPAPAPEKK